MYCAIIYSTSTSVEDGDEAFSFKLSFSTLLLLNSHKLLNCKKLTMNLNETVSCDQNNCCYGRMLQQHSNEITMMVPYGTTTIDCIS